MPFAGYSDFADCVSRNRDKDDPDAYCGSIKHEVEDKAAWSAVALSEFAAAAIGLLAKAAQFGLRGPQGGPRPGGRGKP